MSVTVHPPKTPVTKGSSTIAAATVPNVCKMPGPPAPFVPTPLPNIGRSAIDPKGYSTSVKMDGEPVAIAGASFGSLGDVASKGTGGGIVSNNCEGATKFIAPGSLTVKVEGKRVQLLGDQMLNNHGPSGSPPNAATMAGAAHKPGKKPPEKKTELECGEHGTYGEQLERTGGGEYHRDHIPSKAALKDRAVQLNGGRELSKAQASAIDNLAVSVVIPASAHRDVSPTYGGRNSAERIGEDASDLQAAAKRDTKAMKAELSNHADADCVEAYKKAAKKIEKTTNEDYDNFLMDILETVK